MAVEKDNYNGVSLKSELTNAEVREVVRRFLDGTDGLTEREIRIVEHFMKTSKNTDNADRDTFFARMLSWKKWQSFHRIDLTLETCLAVMEMVLSGDVVIMHEIPYATRKRALEAGMTEEELDA